jgi:hypothetical protein
VGGHAEIDHRDLPDQHKEVQKGEKAETQTAEKAETEAPETKDSNDSPDPGKGR